MLIFSLVGAALLVGIDYFIKFWVVQYLKPIGTFPVIQDVLHFTYHENDGAAFSIFSGHQEFLIGITSIALFSIFLYLLVRRPKSKLLVISLCLILSGGVGNLIDLNYSGLCGGLRRFSFDSFCSFQFCGCCAVIGTGLLIFYFLWTDVILTKRQKKDSQGRLVVGEKYPSEAKEETTENGLSKTD